jgi:type III pantothenate kinase
VPIINRYRTPREVGVDRLVNALAAHRRYRRAVIVIDFGTAITFDFVSKKGEYLGGVIAPGIETSLEALFQKTALLPRIRMAKPRSVMGRDTVESIRAGCAYGIGGLCDRVVEEIRRHYRSKPLVIATGGYARFMRRYSRSIQKIDGCLTLHGIYQTYRSS